MDLGEHNNWRNFLKLESFEGEQKQQIEDTLDQFMLTPEGRETIWKIKELRGDDFVIKPGELSVFDPDHNHITISFKQINENGYITQQGNIQQFYLDRALFHELSHSADPHFTSVEQREQIFLFASREILKENGRHDDASHINELMKQHFHEDYDNKTFVEQVKKYTKNISEEEVNKYIKDNGYENSPIVIRNEKYATNKTNAYMNKYHGEAEREGHGARRICDSDTDTKDMCADSSIVGNAGKTNYNLDEMDLSSLPSYVGKKPNTAMEKAVSQAKEAVDKSNININVSDSETLEHGVNINLQNQEKSLNI